MKKGGTIVTVQCCFHLQWYLRLPPRSNSMTIPTFSKLTFLAPLWSNPDCSGKFVYMKGVAHIRFFPYRHKRENWLVLCGSRNSSLKSNDLCKKTPLHGHVIRDHASLCLDIGTYGGLYSQRSATNRDSRNKKNEVYLLSFISFTYWLCSKWKKDWGDNHACSW